MWKVLLIVVVIVAAGHFALRYLPSNPLDPVVEGGEVVVETNEYQVRFAREGLAGGVYLVESARSEDWTNHPQNASLSVIDFATARAYLSAYPEFRHYGSPSGMQLENVSSKLAVVAANRLAYGDLRYMLELFEERAAKSGERICVGISGEALGISSAVALGGARGDQTDMFRQQFAVQRALFADRIRIDDCAELVGQQS